MEILPINGFKGLYEISSCGRVFSCEKLDRNGKLRKRKELTPSCSRDGYGVGVTLVDTKGVRHKHYVHKIVGEHFIDNPEGMPVVRHLDGDEWNNHRDNLYWSQHVGGCGSPPIPPDKEVLAVREAAYTGEYTLSDLAEKFDRPRSTITNWVYERYRKEE